MSVIMTLRRALASWLLRGPLLQWWFRRKILRIETLCLGHMVEVSTRVPPPAAAVPAPPRPPLRKLLFIADVLWETNELVPELEKIGAVETLDLHPSLAAGGEAAPAVARAVEDHLRSRASAPPDAVLLYATGKQLSDEVFSLLRKACPGPLIGMNLDDKMTFWPYAVYREGGPHYRKWIHHFDLNLTNSKIAATWYRDAGAPHLFMPPAMRPPAGLDRPARADFKYPVSFLGSPKLDRERLINRLRDSNIPVALFGKGWPDARWEADTAAIYRSSQINLGIGMATPNLSTMKNRDFECPGAGACYLTTFNWELAEWWDIGREILCYRNDEELIEMICWYRSRPEECLAIAQAAWDRGRREHTWEVRFRDIFKRLGFRENNPRP